MSSNQYLSNIPVIDNSLIKGGLISESIFNLVTSSKKNCEITVAPRFDLGFMTIFYLCNSGLNLVVNTENSKKGA